MVSGNKFQYKEVWSIIESLGNFSLHRFGCRERDPKPSRRYSFCKKVNSEIDGGNAATGYQENWIWIPRRNKWLSIIRPFQPFLLVLGRTEHKPHNYKKFLNWIEYVNWIFRHAENEFQYRKKHTRDLIRKTKGLYFETRSENVVLKATSMNRTNETYILLKGTRDKFYFQQISPLGFTLGKLLGVTWQLVWNTTCNSSKLVNWHLDWICEVVNFWGS